MLNRVKIENTIYYAAFGDAWGFVTEFVKYEDIISNEIIPPEVLVVSDDTQMAIYTANATQEVLEEYSDILSTLPENPNAQNAVRLIYAKHHIYFALDKDNNRAPGMTCMASLSNLMGSEKVLTGREGSLGNNSKGCGTIMRAPWVGLFPGLSEEEIFSLAVIQSQTTHDHPIGWLVSGIAAVLTHDLLNNEHTTDASIEQPYFVLQAIKICKRMTEIWSHFGSTDYITEVLNSFNHILETWDSYVGFNGDHSYFYGQGWIADEALYTSLAAASKFINSPYEAIKSMVVTSGDSDSIATLTGSFLGAYHNSRHDEVPIEKIKENLEPRYKEELGQVIDTILGE